MNKLLIFIIIILTIVFIILIDEKMEGYHLHRQNKLKINYEKINISQGLKKAKNSTVCICGLARNCIKKLHENKKVIEKIGLLFKKYKIILFENDSNDGTREFIEEWEKKNKNIILIKCDNNPRCILKNKTGYQYGQLNKKRFQKMANYREKYLNYAKKINYDYTMVLDFDLDFTKFNYEGFLNILSKPEIWNGVFINGRSNIPGTFGFLTIPYDSIAYADLVNNCKIPKTTLKKLYFILNNYIKLYKITNKNKIFSKVSSAFNGVAIYKTSSLKNSSYLSNENNFCEHCSLHETMDNLYIANTWISYQPKQGDGNFVRQLSNIMKN